MDTNKDGKISRDEMPEGATRRMFDNMVERFKLDPKKTYTMSELEQATGLGSGGSASSSGASSSSSTNPLSPMRFNGNRRGPGGPGRNGPATRAPSDGRPYRALEDVPDQYRSYDKDGDGQIGLYEWPRERIRDFLALDTNDDGFLTLSELRKAPSGGNREEPKRDEKKDEAAAQPSTSN
jgi:Ca2+-binding EF-hand superfamily protein